MFDNRKTKINENNDYEENTTKKGDADDKND